MGVEFVQRAEKSFRRQWDRGLHFLRSPNLFGSTPKLEERRFAAVPTNGVRLESGRTYGGVLDGNQILVLQANSPVARVPQIPLAIQNRIRNDGCGVVVVQVESVQPISGTADVTIR